MIHTLDTSSISHRSLNGIKKLKDNHYQVKQLFDKLNVLGDIILIGGAIRDFSLDKTPRDIDIIIDTKETNFDQTLKYFSYKKNRFGGYKISIEDIEFDIWSINNNWAFKERIFETRFNNISKGTFYNFDAVTLNINTLDLDADLFLDAVRKKTLDITLEEDFIKQNPSPEVNIMRAFVIKKYWELEFSDKVTDYILEWFEKNEAPINSLEEAELKHYGANRLTTIDYLNF